MGKRLRRAKSICSCVSPRFSYLSPHSIFSWYEEDVWTEIAKFMDGKSLVMLALTCKWFHRILMNDSIWKYACLRDLQVPDPRLVGMEWIKLYASAFDGSHSFKYRQQEKHIDWMRIGSFLFKSSVAFLTESLKAPPKIQKDATEDTLQLKDCCLLKNVKNGIWLADLQLVRCPVCDLTTCDGTMQILDARHIELFLCPGYQDGVWDYEVIGSTEIKKRSSGASGAIFDFEYLYDKSSAGVFDLDSWVGKANDWHPRPILTTHAVAINTNLQENDGLQVKFQVMRAGKGGEVVSIRISQQLL